MIEIKSTNTNEEVKTENEEVKEDDKVSQAIAGSFIISAGVALFGGTLYGIGKFNGRRQSKRELKNYKKGFKDAEKLIEKYSYTVEV
jgi:hypothetical protein